MPYYVYVLRNNVTKKYTKVKHKIWRDVFKNIHSQRSKLQAMQVKEANMQKNGNEYYLKTNNF